MTLAELLKQKADLERQISNAQSETRSKAIADIRRLMQEHGLTSADLVATLKKGPKTANGPRRAVAAKYRDQDGNQWSGRGLKPKWLTAALVSGKKLEDFLI